MKKNNDIHDNTQDIEFAKIIPYGNFEEINEFFENPPHNIKFNTDFILQNILKNYHGIELFCFNYSLDSYEVKRILDNNINFSFKTLVIIALALNCKIKDLFTE